MFNSSASDAGTNSERLTILAAGIKVTGDLVSDGIIKIEGTVEGTVRTSGQVLVAKGGLVDGDVHARECVIGGEIRGAVYADARIEVQAGALVSGDLTTPKLQVHEGGDINGRVTMSAAGKGAGVRPAGTGKPDKPLLVATGS